MTAEMTPNEIAKHMWALGHELEAVTAELVELDDVSVKARRAAAVAKAEAMLRSTLKYQYEREAEALVVTSGEQLAAELATARVRAARARIASIRERIEIGGGVSATLRQQMRL